MFNTESRTTKSLKNSFVAISFTLVSTVLQFFARKIFLDYLGTDILGLNTTIVNLLQFLNLAELGIGTATSFALYKPLKEKDTETLNDIIALQGHLYKRIACLIIIGAIILSLFFPIIFKKITLPLWYTYASFVVMLVSSLLGYFVNFRQILLSANQEEYKISYSFRTVTMIKTIFQMGFIYLFPNHGYIWWLIWEAFFAIVASVSLNQMVSKNFPFLKKSDKSYGVLKESYSWIITKIKQLFFHRIGFFVLTQCSSIIIYALTSLSMVAYYGNYMLIINGVSTITWALFNSLGAGIGNLVAEGNYSRIKDVFIELFSIRFFIVATVCFMVYTLTPEFIRLWIGEQYILKTSILIILTISLYISLFRFTVDAFINAYGLFQDIYAPLVEGAINLILSVILGKIYGLNGILTGVLVSQIVVIAIWKPYFLFTQKMFGMGKIYIQIYAKHIFQLVIAWGLSYYFLKKIHFDFTLGYVGLTLYALISFVIFGSILFASLYLTKSGIQLFVSRILRFSHNN
ncbi:MAG: sugar transporter [Muribaculaceae bacterium]|nr:sugar transporter [Muribaculaceae bacterium]